MPATAPVNSTQTPGGGWHRGTTNAASELLGAVDGIAAGHKDNKNAQKKLKKLEKKPKKKSKKNDKLKLTKLKSCKKRDRKMDLQCQMKRSKIWV